MSGADERAAAPAGGYDAALAAQLVGLAALANQSLENLYLPGDWEVIYSHSAGSAAGGSHFGSRPESANSTISASTPSAHRMPMTVSEKPSSRQ